MGGRRGLGFLLFMKKTQEIIHQLDAIDLEFFFLKTFTNIRHSNLLSTTENVLNFMNISDFFVDFTTEKLTSPDVFLCLVVYAWCSTSVTPTHWPLLREATPGWPAAHDQRHAKETQHDPRPRKGTNRCLYRPKHKHGHRLANTYTFANGPFHESTCLSTAPHTSLPTQATLAVST